MIPAVHGNRGRPFVVTSVGSIGIFSSRAKRWVEFSNAGELLADFTIEPPSTPGVESTPRAVHMVMTADGNVYAYFKNSVRAGSPEPCR